MMSTEGPSPVYNAVANLIRSTGNYLNKETSRHKRKLTGMNRQTSSLGFGKRAQLSKIKNDKGTKRGNCARPQIKGSFHSAIYESEFRWRKGEHKINIRSARVAKERRKKLRETKAK